MTNILTAVVTAYCSCKLCCGNSVGLTAAGIVPKSGITVAIPRQFPLGTRVRIGNHTYVGQDRTARRFDGRFDIYMASHQQARRFGKQTLQITVIK